MLSQWFLPLLFPSFTYSLTLFGGKKKSLRHLAKKELVIKAKVFGKLMMLTVYKSMREMGSLIAVENKI